MKRKFHDFLTLLTSTEKLLTRAGLELATRALAVLENHEIFSPCFSEDDSEIL